MDREEERMLRATLSRVYELSAARTSTDTYRRWLWAVARALRQLDAVGLSVSGNLGDFGAKA